MTTLIETSQPFNGSITGGDSGLDAYRAIAKILPQLLKPTGHAVLEVGHDQAQAVMALLQVAGLKNIRTRRDLAGIGRCVLASLQN